MKKVIFALVAAGMTMTSCMNEEFPNATSYGQLNVNVSNDLQMNTRASVSDLSTWTVKANDGTSEISLTTASTKVKAGTYTVSAQSHASEAAALQDNDGWGAAFYQGTAAPVEVTAGSEKDVTVECGTAKNARLKVQFSLVSNFTEYSLTANRNRVFNESNYKSALAYYAATEVVDYTLSYKYNGTPKQITGNKITMNGAATENIISIASNDNGTISVTINYDDTFGTGNSENLVFDAATGEELANSGF